MSLRKMPTGVWLVPAAVVSLWPSEVRHEWDTDGRIWKMAAAVTVRFRDGGEVTFKLEGSTVDEWANALDRADLGTRL